MRAEPSPETIAAGTAPVRVVVVTMDSNLAQAAAAAEAALRRDIPGLSLVIHGADEWASDPDALESCLADIACGDIVLAAMLFLEDHIRPVMPALLARRDACDAMLGCLSASEVVKLTRIGRFTMDGEAGGAIALLKRLRGGTKPGASSGRNQLKMLKLLPKLLRFIPGTAQDTRNYFLALQYWLAGSAANLEQLVRLLVGTYASGARRPADGALRAAAPIAYPELGLYHPSLPGGITATPADIPGDGRRGTVGLLLMRSYVLAGNAAHYDGVIAAMEAEGLRVLPVFASGLDQRATIEAHFFEAGKVVVDAVVSLTGFSLVGGPAYNDQQAAEAMLARLDVPYLAAHPVEFQTLETWERDGRGLTPVEAAMMVAIPELDGAICPMTFGGRSESGSAQQRRQMSVHPERAGRLAARVARLVRLRRKPRAQRRLAIVLFNFPPNGGSVGTAAYLSVFESLLNTLRSLAEAGYEVEVPLSVEALRRRVLEGNASVHGTAANVAARVPAAEHVAREPHLAEIERQWGPAPGRSLTDGGSIQILGAMLGRVFVGIQPPFGYEGDPMRLLFEGGFAPTHAFSAFYRWIDQSLDADAVLHFGTHGALEFMPGKHAGLSSACWPDRLIGNLPNVYLYASNNPSEGMLAKRRAGAVLVSHLTPALGRAGLYRGLADLRATIDRWRRREPGEAFDPTMASLIRSQAEAVDLEIGPDWSDGTAPAAIDALHLQLVELEQTLIPHGLHVVGRPPDAAARADLLDAAEIVDAQARARLDALLAADHEIPALIRALDARYIRPVVGGDFIRNQDVLPTGRNLHGLDPFRLPSAYAVLDGAAQAERVLARHVAEKGELPRSIAMVLWGTDNLKSEGGPIAQALHLLGATPRHDSYGRIIGAALIPLETLGRPRIDVVLSLSGIFRDLLPLQTRLLAEAAWLASSADEPESMNFVRANTRLTREATGCDEETASLRVFGNASDTYGANVNQLVESGGWTDDGALSDTFVARKSFAYDRRGNVNQARGLFGEVLSRVDMAYQNLDSVELGVTTIDHYFDSLGGISLAASRGRDKGAVSVLVGDQTRGTGQVRSLSEQVALETRTRTLNPAWYEPLLAHGYEGVRQIEAHITNTLGWSATTGKVEPWVYQSLTETFMLEPSMRDRLASLNPAASAKIANRLLEACDRNYWSPDDATRQDLIQAGEEIEDRLEGISVGVAA